MKHSRILQWALTLSLIIILNLFFNFAIRLVSIPPSWEKFCPQQQVTIQPKNQQECVAKGGAWNDYGAVPKPISEPTGYCDLNFTCQKNYQSASDLYNRNVFVALVILGLISLGAGFFVKQSAAVALGLSLGGVLSFIIGTIRYWSNMDDYLRVIILGLALAALIWIGVKKLRE